MEEFLDFFPSSVRALFCIVGLTSGEETYRLSIMLPTETVQLYRWGLRWGLPISHKFLEALVEHGSIEVYKVMKSRQLLWCKRFVKRMAYRHGRTDFIEDGPSEISQREREECIRGGHLDFVKKIHGGDLPRGAMLGEIAAQAGQIHILQTMKDSQILPGGRASPFCENHLIYAIRGGQIKAIEFLLRNGCELTKECAFEAVKAEHLDVLRFLRNRSCPWSPEAVMREAVQIGNIEILEALRDGSLGEVCPFEPSLFEIVISKDNPYMVKKLREMGCPWNANVTSCAAYHERLEIFTMLRDGTMGEKCPWEPSFMHYLNKFPEIVSMYERGEFD